MGRSHRIRWAGALAGVGALALLATTVPLWGANLGRKIEWFEVQRVEVTGTRLIAPHEILKLSGVAPGRHLLDEVESTAAAILEHRGIERVEVTRRAPHTLRIHIQEKQPVAYVEGEVLRLASARGEILPFDPVVAPLDLPIVRGPMADSAGSVRTRRLLAEIGRLTALDPAFVAQVSEVAWTEEGEALLLTHRLGTVLLPFGAATVRMAQLHAVFADLERRFALPAADDRLTRHKIDLRFGDQIVVHPPLPPERS
jgi:cell division septal protein FtsQ